MSYEIPLAVRVAPGLEVVDLHYRRGCVCEDDVEVLQSDSSSSSSDSNSDSDSSAVNNKSSSSDINNNNNNNSSRGSTLRCVAAPLDVQRLVVRAQVR
jgi:hypothetical protein